MMFFRANAIMLVFLVIGLVLIAPLVRAQEAEQSAEAASITSRVDKILQKWDKPNSPGCALAVIKDGRLVYKRAYGMANLDHDMPIKPSTVFNIASVTKQFTAAAIALLAQQKLSLDDEVRKYIPAVPDLALPSRSATSFTAPAACATGCLAPLSPTTCSS